MNITVDTDLLNSLGGTIDGYGDSYLDQVRQIYETIDSLNQSWSGADSSSYIEKIEGYRTDIENLGKAIKNYGAFLKEASTSIANLRSQIQTESGKL